MRNLILSSLILVGMLGCVGRVQVRDELQNPLPDKSIGITSTMASGENSRGKPIFAKDGLLNSELQVKAYESAINWTNQTGHFFGGFFFGTPYAISTSFFKADPPIIDLMSFVPIDSCFWYSRYYNQEVTRIRSINAWWGFGTRIVVGIFTYLIINRITQGNE